MIFGSYFRNLRQSKNATQKKIAEVIDKNPMLVSNIENDKNSPFSEDDLKKISNFLELSKSEENELFKEAARQRGMLPHKMQSYIIDNDELYALIEVLVEKEPDKDSLLEILQMVKERI